jgi:hypothetical protein
MPGHYDDPRRPTYTALEKSGAAYSNQVTRFTRHGFVTRGGASLTPSNVVTFTQDLIRYSYAQKAATARTPIEYSDARPSYGPATPPLTKFKLPSGEKFPLVVPRSRPNVFFSSGPSAHELTKTLVSEIKTGVFTEEAKKAGLFSDTFGSVKQYPGAFGAPGLKIGGATPSGAGVGAYYDAVVKEFIGEGETLEESLAKIESIRDEPSFATSLFGAAKSLADQAQKIRDAGRLTPIEAVIKVGLFAAGVSGLTSTILSTVATKVPILAKAATVLAPLASSSLGPALGTLAGSIVGTTISQGVGKITEELIDKPELEAIKEGAGAIGSAFAEAGEIQVALDKPPTVKEPEGGGLGEGGTLSTSGRSPMSRGRGPRYGRRQTILTSGVFKGSIRRPKLFSLGAV